MAKRNGGYIIAVQSGVDGNDTGDDGLAVVYIGSMIWTRLSCRKLKGNHAASVVCAGVKPRESASGGLMKIGANVVRHAKYATLQMPEVAVPLELFVAILERIRRFGALRPLVQGE